MSRQVLGQVSRVDGGVIFVRLNGSVTSECRVNVSLLDASLLAVGNPVLVLIASHKVILLGRQNLIAGGATVPPGGWAGGDIASDAIARRHLQDRVVDETAIAQGAVTEALIAVDAVTGAKIADRAVDSVNIALQGVINDNIADGTISGDSKIQAKSVTARSMSIGSFDNLITFGTFGGGTFGLSGPVPPSRSPDISATTVNYWTFLLNASSLLELEYLGAGTFSPDFHHGYQLNDAPGNFTAHTQVTPGDRMYFEAKVRRQNAATIINDARVRIAYYNGSRAFISYGDAQQEQDAPGSATTGVNQTCWFESAAPAGALYAVPEIHHKVNGRTGDALWTSPYMRRKVDGQLVVDGTVTAKQIAALTITAAEIKAGTIGTDQLTAGGVNADRLVARSIQADRIAAYSITAEEIAASTINALLVDTYDLQIRGIFSTREFDADPNFLTLAKVAAAGTPDGLDHDRIEYHHGGAIAGFVESNVYPGTTGYGHLLFRPPQYRYGATSASGTYMWLESGPANAGANGRLLLQAVDLQLLQGSISAAGGISLTSVGSDIFLEGGNLNFKTASNLTTQGRINNASLGSNIAAQGNAYMLRAHGTGELANALFWNSVENVATLSGALGVQLLSSTGNQIFWKSGELYMSAQGQSRSAYWQLNMAQNNNAPFITLGYSLATVAVRNLSAGILDVVTSTGASYRHLRCDIIYRNSEATTSAPRLKRNAQQMRGAAELVRRTPTHLFQYTPEAVARTTDPKEGRDTTDDWHVGWMADAVPDILKTGAPEDDGELVTVSDAPPILWAAVGEIATELDALRADLAALTSGKGAGSGGVK